MRSPNVLAVNRCLIQRLPLPPPETTTLLQKASHRMSARHKLNQTYIAQCVIGAAIIGLLFQSSSVFAVAAGIFITSCIQAGEIRPDKRKPDRGPEKIGTRPRRRFRRGNRW